MMTLLLLLLSPWHLLTNKLCNVCMRQPLLMLLKLLLFLLLVNCVSCALSSRKYATNSFQFTVLHCVLILLLLLFILVFYALLYISLLLFAEIRPIYFPCLSLIVNAFSQYNNECINTCSILHHYLFIHIFFRFHHFFFRTTTKNMIL